MHRGRLCLLALLLLILLPLVASCELGKPHTRRSPSPPTVQATTPSPSPAESSSGETISASIFFFDRDHGWAGGKGAIFVTKDGGRNWRRGYYGRALVSAIDFVGDSRGWAVADDTLLETSDGASWKTIARTLEKLNILDFVGPTRGWAVTPAEHLLTTSDEGRTWRRVVLPVKVQSVCFSNARRGWAAGHGRVYATSDRGSSWKEVFEARTKPYFTADFQTTVHCSGSGVWGLFADGGASSQQSYFVERSLDSGRTWKPVSQGAYISPLGSRTPELEEIGSYSGPFSVPAPRISAFVGVCVTCDPQPLFSIDVTADGGRTWMRHTITRTVTYWVLTGVSFVDAQHGWIVGGIPGRGEIRATVDGGKTWRVQLVSSLL